MDRGEDQVALVLAIVVVGDDDDLAALEGADGVDDPSLHDGPSVAIGERRSLIRTAGKLSMSHAWRVQPTWPRWRR